MLPEPTSAGGSRFVERLLTVRDTLRRQQRNVLDYLRAAVRLRCLRSRPLALCFLPPTPPIR